jgi:hypothetical protein
VLLLGVSALVATAGPSAAQTTTTAPASCTWEYGGVAEATPAPCEASPGAWWENVWLRLQVGVGLLIFAAFCVMVVKFRG